MSESARCALLCLLLASWGCGGEEPAPHPGMGGNSSGAGQGGAAGRAGAGQGGGGSGSALVHNFGVLGSGTVTCPNATETTCSAGKACCTQVPFKADSCVDSLSACPCGPNWDRCSVTGCDEPGDCPGAVCCATINLNRSGLHEFAGSSCKPGCDPAADIVVCNQISDCASGQSCMQSSENYKRCF